MVFTKKTETKFLKNPIRIEKQTVYNIYGEKKLVNTFFSGEVIDEAEFYGSQNQIKRLNILGLTKEQLAKVKKEVLENVEVLQVWYASHSLKFIEECKELKEVLINCDYDELDPNKRKINLWDTSKNTKLEKLILHHPDIDDISNLANSTISHFEIERGRFYLGEDLPFKIKTDFSVFLTMKNLKVLKLWIEPIEDNYNNLVAISKLTQLEEIFLPKHYFTFMQFAFLKSKLVNAKGLEPFKEYRNRQQDRFEYMRIGSDTKREFVPMTQELLNVDIQEYNMLVGEFKNVDLPPKNI